MYPAVVAALLGGCSDPYADETGEAQAPPPEERSSRTPPVENPRPPAARGDALPPRRSPSRLRGRVVGGASPRALARTFAARSLNWTWRDPDAPYRALLPHAIGPLRDELARTRSAVRADDTIARDRLGSRGRFVAVDARGVGKARKLVVVVREETLIGGRGSLEGPRHRVYRAEARLTAAGWGMRRWAPVP